MYTLIAASLSFLSLASAGPILDWGKALATIPAELYNASAVSSAAPSGKIAYCSKAGAHASAFTATIVPLGPTAGQDVLTTFQYTLDKVVTTGATATYSVTYNFLPLTPTVDDLCADQKDDLCPLAIGLHNSKSNSAWPSGLSGTIVSKIQWKDQDGQEILCMQWTVSGN